MHIPTSPSTGPEEHLEQSRNRGSFRRRSHSVLVVFCLLTASLAGCKPAAESMATEQSAVALPKVATAKPSRKTITQKSVQPGQIQALSTTPNHAKVAGYVDQLKADIGDRVKGPVRDSDGSITEPGQLLALLSAPELGEEFAQKEAMVEQVKAEVLQSEAAVKVAISMQVSAGAGIEESQAGQARAKAQFERWKSEYDRIQTLADSKTVTPKLAEETKLQFKSAPAGQSEADAKLKSARAAESEAAVAVEKAQADVQATAALSLHVFEPTSIAEVDPITGNFMLASLTDS